MRDGIKRTGGNKRKREKPGIPGGVNGRSQTGPERRRGCAKARFPAPGEERG